MNILTVNTGSTSVKLAAFAAMGTAQPTLVAKENAGSTGENASIQAFLAKHTFKPDVVAHRVVHGGTRFTRPACIDAPVLAEIGALSELAPLHNPKALKWIEAARQVCGPKVVQVAAFDTSFFVALPRVAAEYALPPQLGTDLGVRRYGFHGLAHEAMWRRWSELHPELSGRGRLISLQLGGGASVAATLGGHPVDTSMGFSPLEGLVMGTRSGDVDAAIVPHLQRRLGKSADEVIDLLNHEAGLVGLSGLGPERGADFRALLADPGPRPRFAVDLYCYRARKYLGAYLTVLGGCDGIVFGGGVGEHVPPVRSRILEGLSWAGIEVSEPDNERAVGAEARISTPQSRIGVHVIPVDEERMLAAAALAECTPP